MKGDGMTQQKHFESEFKELLSEIDSKLHEHLLKLNLKEGSPIFAKWFVEGHKPICGVQITYRMLFSIVDPPKRKELVKNYAEMIKNIFGKGYYFPDLKEAVERVFDDLIAERKAIMFGLQSQFLRYLWRLTHEAYQRIQEPLTERVTLPDNDMKDTDWSATIMLMDKEEQFEELNKDENRLVAEIFEKQFRDSLEPVQREIWKDFKDGCSIRYSEKRLNVPKTTVAEIRQNLEAKRKELEEN
jgi:hypothetical protein